MDTVIMGNAPLWDALQERETLYAKGSRQLTDRRRHASRRTRRHRRRRRRLHGGNATPPFCSTGWIFPSRCTSARWASCRAARRCGCCWRRRCSATRTSCCWTSPRTTSISIRCTGCRIISARYEGCLIVISHDRHFLNEICTHIADIDYQTVITYTGGYDDMVLAKTQVRSRIEAGNAQREKKIAQLNEFIARFAAGTRSSQVTSRKKEVERLQTSELAKSNIQRPFIRFEMERPSGRHPLEVKELSQVVRRTLPGDSGLHRFDQPRREDRADRAETAPARPRC